MTLQTSLLFWANQTEPGYTLTLLPGGDEAARVLGGRELCRYSDPRPLTCRQEHRGDRNSSRPHAGHLSCCSGLGSGRRRAPKTPPCCDPKALGRGVPSSLSQHRQHPGGCGLVPPSSLTSLLCRVSSDVLGTGFAGDSLIRHPVLPHSCSLTLGALRAAALTKKPLYTVVCAGGPAGSGVGAGSFSRLLKTQTVPEQRKAVLQRNTQNREVETSAIKDGEKRKQMSREAPTGSAEPRLWGWYKRGTCAEEQIKKPEAADKPSQPRPFLLSHAGPQQVRDADAAHSELATAGDGRWGQDGRTALGVLTGVLLDGNKRKHPSSDK
ncbi:uncharacterized protein LOC116798181 [Chiroxiphia lanceolata]|uniref:uncharacterized protein LOC116798181 n=1 Tax=Chiroxiphia lanceolata TaxID=296741 RepID=UPI0013CECE3E|nr:uncharacterized protein LOC116798181 [Chiroxiphia lanceolata]